MEIRKRSTLKSLVKLQLKFLWLEFKRNRQKKNPQKTVCLFLVLLCLFLSLRWNFWPQLDCKYESSNFLVTV